MVWHYRQIFLDPYFFEEKAPTGLQTCSVIASRYTAMLQNYVIPELFQRKCTKLHCLDARQCTSMLSSLLILETVVWSLHHLTLFSLFVTSEMNTKFRIYMCNSQALSILKNAIKSSIAIISYFMQRSAFLSVFSSMQCVIACDDTHEENIWSK